MYKVPISIAAEKAPALYLLILVHHTTTYSPNVTGVLMVCISFLFPFTSVARSSSSGRSAYRQFTLPGERLPNFWPVFTALTR